MEKQSRLFQISSLYIVVFLSLVVLATYSITQTHQFAQPLAQGDENNCPWVLEAGEIFPQEKCLISLNGIHLQSIDFIRDPSVIPGEVTLWWQRQKTFSSFDSLSTVEAQFSDGSSFILPIKSNLASRLGYLFIGVLFSSIWLLVGVVLLRKRPKEIAAKSFSLLSTSAGVAILCTVYFSVRGLGEAGFITNLFLFMNHLALALIPAALVYFAYNFPRENQSNFPRKLSFLIGFFGLISFLFYVLMGTLEPLHYFYFPITLLFGMIVLVRNIRRATGTLSRLQIRWVFWSFLMATPPAIAPPLYSLITGTTRSVNFDLLMGLLTAIVPIGIAFAILRYRLFDIDIIIRRSAIGAVLLIPAMFGYFWVLSTLGMSVTGGVEGSSLTFLVAAFLGFIFLPAQTQIAKRFDKVFHRNEFSARERIQTIPETLSGFVEPQAIVKESLDVLVDAFSLRGIVFLSINREKGTFKELAVQGEFLENPLSPLNAQKAKNLDQLSFPEEVGLPSERVSLIVPVRSGKRPVGILILGMRRTSTLYRAPDLQVMQTLSAAMGLALENARTYARIARMNEELEKKVEERTLQLKQAQAQLVQQEKMSSLGLLVAGVAHELNTPLATLLSNTEMLYELTEEIQQGDISAIEDIHAILPSTESAAKRAADIVRRLRIFSRLDEAERKSVDLVEGLEATLGIIRSRLGDITVHRDYKEIPQIECYPGLLNQALLNLLVNATDALQGKGELYLSLFPTPEGGVCFTIKDSGMGIPPEVLSKIFDPFFTTKPPGEGTGLGLAITYSIIRRHGGSIDVKSISGEGTTFLVTIPQKAPEKPPKPDKFFSFEISGLTV